MTIDSHPVWAELVEALFFSFGDGQEEGQPFDKLRAHGFSGYRA